MIRKYKTVAYGILVPFMGILFGGMSILANMSFKNDYIVKLVWILLLSMYLFCFFLIGNCFYRKRKNKMDKFYFLLIPFLFESVGVLGDISGVEINLLLHGAVMPFLWIQTFLPDIPHTISTALYFVPIVVLVFFFYLGERYAERKSYE